MIVLIIPSLLLSFFGMFTVFGIKQNLIYNEVFYVIIGFMTFIFIRKIGRHFFQTNSKFFYWLFIFVLILTFIIGFESKGSKRWIDFYFFKFQASEFFKVFFILFLAELLTRSEIQLNRFSAFVKSFLYFLLPTLIIFKQPDLGNAMVFAFIYLVMLLFSDLPKKYLLYLLAGILMILPLGWFFLQAYQRERLTSFLNPHLDTQGAAYNMIQAVITVGSGKFLGRGLGFGTQSRLYFLPENHTDFAYSSLVEQFGFLGGLVVIILYGVIIYHLAKRIIKFYFQKDSEGKKKFLYLIGLLSYLGFQIFVNIGMNLGLFPVTGIALPFVSYGGSSVVALLIGFALLP